MTREELQFLRMANDKEFRTILLERLEQLGLLSAFLEAESEPGCIATVHF